MNVKLLEKVKQHILAEPKRLDMGIFICRKEHGKDDGRDYPRCGTIACIAGWAVSLSENNLNRDCPISERAAELLELSASEESRLFYEGRWPGRFAFQADVQSEDAAKATAARIDHFIATNGAE